MGTQELILVRHLNMRGDLHYQYLKADGNLPRTDAVVDETVHRPSSIFGDKYQLARHSKTMPSRSLFLRTLLDNLRHLNRTNPFLFEEFLVYCENMTYEESGLVANILNVRKTPDAATAIQNTHAEYRAIITMAPFLTSFHQGEDAETAITLSLAMFKQAHKYCKNFDHPHLKTAALAHWVMAEYGTMFSPLLTKDHESDIAYLNANFNVVYSARDVIKRARSIEKSYVSEVLNGQPAIREGAL